MNRSVEQTMSGLAVETVSARDVVPLIKQWFQKRFRPLDHNQLKRELNLSREERQSERARNARKLHDTLFQASLGASMLQHDPVEKMPADPSDKHSLSGSLRLVQLVLGEGRMLLHGFRAPDLASETIEQALSGVLEDFSPAGVRCEICVTGKPKSLQPAILEQITLIGREALVNALLHSEATRIEAEVEYSPRRLRLIVRDNGRGMEPHVARSGKDSHWGLLGMRERAGRIGAQLSIWSRSGAGTEVEISVPNQIAANACA